MLDAQTGRLVEARAGYTRALELARALGDPAAEQQELHELAVLESTQGHLAEAQANYEQALAAAKQLGDPSALQQELRNFGIFLARKRGEVARGRSMIEESLVICEQLGDIYYSAYSHQFLAVLDEDAGDRASAIAHYRQALRLFEQVQSPDADKVRAALRRLGVE